MNSLPSDATLESAPDASPPVIEVRDLVKRFAGRTVLNGVSLDVRRGETVVIIGSSGCGKSTLLRILTGAIAPTSGEVRLFDEPLDWHSESRLTAVRRRFGVLFQSGALLQSLTVGENVALPIREHSRLDDPIVDLMVKMKLALVGLSGAEHLRPAEISGGMRKRAGLARALALDPELLFSDEPTSGLDPVMTTAVDQLTQNLTRRLGMSALVVTHDMTSAFRIGSRIIMLGTGDRQGTIIAAGSVEEIMASTDPMVKQFIQGQTDGRMTFGLSAEAYLEKLRENHQPVQCP